MKDISELSKCLEDMGEVLEKHLMDAQSKAADLMWQDAYANARRDTGAYALSIHKEPTEIVDGKIETFIGSGMQVMNSKGDIYNLGALLEYGTDPHLIEPVNCDYLHFKTDDGKWVKTKLVHHPGTPKYNTYRNARLNNEVEYQNLLAEAILKAFEEGFK